MKRTLLPAVINYHVCNQRCGGPAFVNLFLAHALANGIGQRRGQIVHYCPLARRDDDIGWHTSSQSLLDVVRNHALAYIDTCEVVGRLPFVVAADTGPAPHRPLASGRPVTIASYGFFLPNKGLPQLIEAIHLLRQRQLDYRLLLVNAEFPAEISRQLIDKARGMIRDYGLGPYVEMETRFLSDEESLRKLSRSDAVVYAYQETSESASGAVRYGLASGKPVITTPIPIFQDVADLVFRTPGTTPAEIADGIDMTIAALRAATPEAQQTLEDCRHWRESHGYPLLGQRLAGMLRGIFRDDRIAGKAG